MSEQKKLKKVTEAIERIKTGKVSMIDTIPTACKLARAVFEAKKGAYKQEKELEKIERLAMRFLQDLNRIVPEANLLEGIDTPKGHVAY